MSRAEILNKLNEIFRDIFDEEDIEISEETKPEDIEDWDSIGHVYLTFEIEDEFKIKLGEKINAIENVKDIIDLIEEAMERRGQ